MDKKTVSFSTLGCRYNRSESAEIAHEMEKAGYENAKVGESADVVVINTCAVTAKSAAKCRNAIRNAREENPGAKVVVTGCYSELSPEDVAAVAGVDLVVGNADKFNIGEVLKTESNVVSIFKNGELADGLDIRPVERMEGRTNAYLNIQSGCDEVCSFCVVRIARGNSRSANAQEVVTQVARLSDSGVREVVLSGINIGHYQSLDGDRLAGLIQRILSNTNIERIRLSSINPNNVTDELIELMASEERFCRHLHIPLQSGSDRILNKMKRPYTATEYQGIVEQLVERVDGIGIGADVMVGFPDESETDYHQTRDLLNRLPVMMLHVFAYSRRQDTEAAKMAGLPPKNIAKQRSAELKKLSLEKGSLFRQSFVGQTVNVLAENVRDTDGNLKGFTDNYMPVAFDGPDGLHNHIVRVRLISEHGGNLLGKADI